MLRRVRQENRKSRFFIPRHGRIRIILIFIAVVSTAFFLFSRPPRILSGRTDIEKPAAQDSRRIRRAHKKKPRGQSARLNSGSKLTREGVSALLQQYPPSLNNNTDTLHTGKVSLTVHFSLDTGLQQSVLKNFNRYHPKYGAAVAINPHTGRVLVLAEYHNPEEAPLAQDLYCRSILPAASIMKIITAAAGIEKGSLTAASTIRTAGNNHTLYHFQLTPELKNYRDVTLEEAFAYSINPVFARIGLYTIGAASMREYLQKFGFNEPVPFDLQTDASHAVVSDSAYTLAELTSGFNQSTSISPMFGALLAAMVSNRGYMPVPTLVDSITDIRTGERLYAATTQTWRSPVQTRTASELCTLMRAVARFGTARKSFVYIKQSQNFGAIEYGGKTGNIELDGTGRVDWFVGFARNPSDSSQQIALAVVTVHGPYWTVHSSFLGAETIRTFIRTSQLVRKNTGQRASDSLKTAQTPGALPPG
jgi:cell division protein FtsI/penicillin-binding protein 2